MGGGGLSGPLCQGGGDERKNMTCLEESQCSPLS